jgi:hypothetical protein
MIAIHIKSFLMGMVMASILSLMAGAVHTAFKQWKNKS